MPDKQQIETGLSITQLPEKVNDFSITIGTVNGSGSQTSNLTILRSIFKMGIPVSGKNLFPSNIKGLPTWFTIRVSKDGFIALSDKREIVVAMNPSTFDDDLASVSPGGVFLYSEDIKSPVDRTDIVVYTMPVKRLISDVDIPSNLREYVANMVYVGVLAYLLDIDMKRIRQVLEHHFKEKVKPVEINFQVTEHAFNWAEQNVEKQDPHRLEPMDTTQGYILTDGNTAAALGSIYGGIQFASWYPITPATSLIESLLEYLPLLRKDPNHPDKNTYVILQAEDELAAIGMAVGAGWAGLRSMTSTSGPGLSLMTEYAGMAYFAEVPLVIWDVQRAGPSTGLPTRTAQGDLTFVNFIGHGDTQQIILLPGSVNECFEFGWKAFDLAERIQTPVFVLSDLDFGMNQWMAKPFDYPDVPLDRGKVLWEEDLERISGIWARYRDVDGDGIPYRTIPGNHHPRAAYFTRGSGHDENADYSEDNINWHDMLSRLKYKYESSRDFLPPPVLHIVEGADIGVIGFGSTDPAIQEARFLLERDGIKTSYLRIRAIPFVDEVRQFIHQHSQTYVIEMNRDGQLNQLLSIEYPGLSTRCISIAFTDGLPLTAKFIFDALISHKEK